ncbi:amino acid transporter [Lentithecium fluviatile CBS 122367]|uniref:Amino acid transporter n=1 Tax=Lentithecium fluviatile CBS 122367 TaxID=1168545 RepID=A0A6G1J657_9PLEO|nr:amino acid transporter [Lentithecium fluviatile CBS 122367]
MASATDRTASGQPDLSLQDDDSSINSALFDILPENIPNSIITKAPEERFRLGSWSVVGLIVNRVIGTGIFNSPTTIMHGTGSVGITLLFWVVGAIYTTAGAYLSVEFGLTTPRHKFEGVKQGIPRSGGTLNYLQYVYTWPAYRHRTVLLITCVFATAYIVLGNMAGNCIIFGIRILEAADTPVTNPAVRGLAIGAATFACSIHALSRRGGIWLGNIFAFVKVCMLLMMIIVGICAWAGAFDSKEFVWENMAAENSFAHPANDSYGYVKAFLSMIFAWGGFDQPNYVLGEIGRPRKKFPRGTAIGVSIIIVLYILVNISYMIVVPKAEQVAGNVALAFFQRTLGSVSADESLPRRILAAFMAVSSFGNIVVMTFTAARVKQEIAKEGILPWAKFFGQSKNLSFGRFLSWIQKDRDSMIGRNFYWLLKRSWMDPREHSQETPFGALFLHWAFTILMIAVTSNLKPTDAYTLLVDMYTYTIVSIFGFIVAVGMLRLRFSRGKRWQTKSPFRPAFSILSAFIFALGSGYPIIASWVPPSKEYTKKTQLAVDWFTTPVVAWSFLGLGVAWYQAFKIYAWRRARTGGVEFQVQKVPEFDRDPPPDGPPVQVHETVFLAWVAKENNSVDLEMESRRSMESF